MQQTEAPAAVRFQIVRPRPMAKRLDIHVVTLWRWVRDGHFPKPLRIGPNVKGWTEEMIADWLASRGR
jgi:prophage regulatory protein